MTGRELAYPGNVTVGQLTSSIAASGATTFTVSGWPSSIPTAGLPFVCEVGPGLGDDEKILLDSFSGGTATIDPSGRGWDGTTAQLHNPGEKVVLRWDSTSATQFATHIFSTSEDDHTQYLDVARHDITARHGPSVVLHGNTGNLGDDDHTQYALNNGTRALTGVWNFPFGVVVGGPGPFTVDNAGDVSALDYKIAGLPGATSGGRFVGVTAQGPPTGLTSGPFSVGDFVYDLTGAMFVCVIAGSPGTWSVPVGGLVGHAIGAATTIDIGNSGVLTHPHTVCTLPVSLIAGLKYMVYARGAGEIFTNVPDFINLALTDTASLLPGPWEFLLTLGSQTFTVGAPVNESFSVGLSVGGIYAGSVATLLSPSGTLGTVVSETLNIVGDSTGVGSAWRVTENACEIAVVRVA